MNNRPKPSMVVRGITHRAIDDYIELSAKVNCPRADLYDERVWYRIPEHLEEHVTDRADPFLAAMLLPAMFHKCPLVLEGTVSEGLLDRCSQVMMLFDQWLYKYRPVEIVPEAVEESHGVGSETGCFASGGVDSFYTILKNFEYEKGENRINHLIYIKNQEEPIRIENCLAEVSGILGVNPLKIETNLKRLKFRGSDWGMQHGPVYASVVLALGTFFKRVYIGSTYSYGTARPQGSHPLLDPLWSNGSMEIIHDGCEASRCRKIIKQIAKSEIAQKYLHVCHNEKTTNCGKCRKCLITMLILDILGELEKFESFGVPLDYDEVMKLDINQPMNAVCIDDILYTFGDEHSDNRSYQAVLELSRRKRKYICFHRFKKLTGEYYTKAIQHLYSYYFRHWIGELDRRYLGSFLGKILR